VSEYATERERDVFAAAEEQFARAREWVAGEGAARLEHADLEKAVGLLVRELGRLLVQAHLQLREAREVRRPAVAGPDLVVRTRAEKGHGRGLATVFGEVTVARIAYRAPGAGNVHPADRELNLPAGLHSHGLGEKLAVAAAGVSVAAACEEVFRETGVRIGTRQAGEIIGRAAADFGSFYASRRPAARDGTGRGQVLVLQADGKGIRMRPDSLRRRAARQAARSVPKQDGRLSRGEVRTRKRIAETGAVFEISQPAARTAAGILPGPGETGSAAGPPGVARKWLTSSVAGTAAQVIAAVFAEADRRDPAREMTWVALADGNNDQLRYIEAEAAARGIEVPVILDIIHVTEYLWDAAWCFFPADSPAAGAWVRQHARAILDGAAATVAAAIRAQATTTEGLPAHKRTTAGKTARYLDNKAPYLGYPAALAAGWPISTGIIEGACRHLVKDRMDITGARWSTNGAEAILKLRAIRANDHWDDYWTWHLQQERERNHPLAA
jgi:hypothetical protein